jgi:hypothetical protein
MIEDELREVLKALVDEIRAVSARIVDHDEPPGDTPVRSLALGGGEFLRVELPRPASDEPAHDVEVETAFERATRQLRAIRRRWQVARLPELAVVGAAMPHGQLVLARIQTYLEALARIDRASNAFVTKGTQLIASARPPDEGEATRWPFLARRALTSHAPGSSHAEIVDPDAYAMSFWYDAALVVLLAEPYALDFVRHRCRQVARELANLLPMLDPDPEAPAAIGPRPRRPTQR